MEVAADKQASDIFLLDIREVSSFADYFVLCNGESERQMETIRDEIDRSLTQDGLRLLGQEGAADSGWILLDCGAVIVHIFAPQERAYYGLDRLWGEALPVIRIQ
ncbi:MAG: ribosome silencing factor [Chloroflexota bacterium]